jgi:DHA1 family bicyclomycin/chloramphenicol resistance-like MFS transporter
MAGHQRVAGSASALFGLAAFGLGGLAAPLVGVAGAHDALPMAITMAAAAATGVLILHTAVSRDTSVTTPPQTPPPLT